MSCTQHRPLVSFVSVLCIYHAFAHDVIKCNGDCDCPSTSTHKSCTLRCNGNHKCENSTLTCRQDDTCTIDCNGAYACTGSTIHCGAESCSISCQGGSNCQNTIVHVYPTTAVECSGNCDSLSIYPSYNPTVSPTLNPLLTPSSRLPTIVPTNNPTHHPTVAPTKHIQTSRPTRAPSTNNPTSVPTNNPTRVPTSFPTTNHPSQSVISTHVPDSIRQNLSISSTSTPLLDVTNTMFVPSTNQEANTVIQVHKFGISIAMWYIIKAAIGFCVFCICVCLCIALFRKLFCRKRAVSTKPDEAKQKRNDTTTITMNRLVSGDIDAFTFNNADLPKEDRCDDMYERSETTVATTTNELNLADKDAYKSGGNALPCAVYNTYEQHNYHQSLSFVVWPALPPLPPAPP
eukprot:542421_1